MKKTTALGGVRVVPSVVPIGKLANCVNMYLDRTDPVFGFSGADESQLNPFGSRCERILLWGAPGTGKARALSNIVTALGPERALCVRGAELADPDRFAQVVSFLAGAKQTNISVVLAVIDFDSPAPNGGERLFDQPPRDNPADAPVPENSPPLAAEPSAPPEEATNIPGRTRASALDPETLRAQRRAERAHFSRSIVAQFPLSERMALGGDMPPAVQILRAAGAEDVPALLLFSQSSPMAPDPTIGPRTSLFDGNLYAPLPSRGHIRALWEEVLRTVPTSPDIDIEALADLSDGLTTEDLLVVVRRAVRACYVANPRPLDDITIGQVDLLGAMLLPTFAFERWAQEAMLNERVNSAMSFRAGPQPKLNHAMEQDLERLSRGKLVRADKVPTMQKEAALGELSGSRSDSSKGGWDSLLNGALG